MPAKKEISFLPAADNQSSLTSRFMIWLTTVGRFVIVFTELIVITAFISRFWLDRRNADLSEVIRQQRAILSSTGQFEAEYTVLQQKFKILKQLLAAGNNLDQQIISLTKSVPNDIVFDNLALSSDQNSPTSLLTVSAYREESIVNFITNLTLNPDIESVNVKRIEKKSKDARYLMDIALIFNKNKAK